MAFPHAKRRNPKYEIPKDIRTNRSTRVTLALAEAAEYIDNRGES